MKKHLEKDIVIENAEVQNQSATDAIPAFPVSERTKRQQSKTSVLYTVASVVLHILAYLPIIIVSLVLGIKCYNLMPYYSFWPFVGTILAGVLGLVFMTVVLVVARKKSKKSIRTQTVKILIAFVCLTTVFGLLFTYIVPDVIAKATQNTLYCEDLYYKGAEQAEKNAKLERDFIMYNVLNGNLNYYDDNGKVADKGDFSYTTLSKREEENGTFIRYYNQEIQNTYDAYMRDYKDIKTIKSQVIDVLEKNAPRRYELYSFIYTNYVLNDYDYAFTNNVERRAFTLALVDYIYTNYDYEGMLKTGFNDARLKALFQKNYDSFNHDGYNPFDDPLLLYAQVNGRMTIPVVVRLILNDGWQYSQGGFDDSGEVYFTEDGNCLYQLYDPDKVAEFEENGGTFDYEGKLIDENGNEITVKYGFNEDGWMMYENGVTKRPMKWLVLDMLGDPMAITTLDLNALAGDVIATAIQQVIAKLPTLVDALGGLVQEDLIDVVLKEATGGAALNIGLCFDDDGKLAINLFSMNAPYGMLGYMQATWVDSNNLLMAVINVVGLRNWLCIFGAVGAVLVVAAGVCREMGEKTRNRTEIARSRIMRAKNKGTLGDESASSQDETDGGEAQNTPVGQEPVAETT